MPNRRRPSNAPSSRGKVMRTCYAILLLTICATGFAQSNAPRTDDAAPPRDAEAGASETVQEAPARAVQASTIPACPKLDLDDEGVQAALAAYCRAVLAAHHAAVHAAVTAAAAAVEREVQPELAAARADADAARAAHRACTIEGAILGAAVAVGAHLLHAAIP